LSGADSLPRIPGKRGPKPKPLALPLEQLEDLYEDFKSGETLAQVGAKVGMTAGSIDRQFEKAGLKSKEATAEHWKKLMDGKTSLYWGKRGRKPSHSKKPLVTKDEFEKLGESLQAKIIHRVIANARKRHRVDLVRGKDMSDKSVRRGVKEEMDLWDSGHGMEWAKSQLPD
jgi:hypothetical protein